MPSAKMYSGESQYTKGRLKNNGKEKQQIVLGRSLLAFCVCVMDGVCLLH
jgi:hypothetical protein